MWYDVRCVAARECLKACPQAALDLTPQGMRIDRTRCNACSDCVIACPSAALEVIGREWTSQALLAEVARDAAFFAASNGGVTISGGEPMLQADFVAEFLQLCREAGIATALDTCGFAPWERFEWLLPFVDLVLYDLKLVDTARHKAATGADNVRILDNARRIAADGKPMWVRTPIIPGYTDDRENIAAIGSFIHENLPTVERWDLLGFNRLGVPKYRRLGLAYAFESTPYPTRAEMEALHAIAIERVPVAVWSGATR
jgi:pyruvate formate lyase activating enzyme